MVRIFSFVRILHSIGVKVDSGCLFSWVILFDMALAGFGVLCSVRSIAER